MSIVIAYICGVTLVGASMVQLLIAALFRKRFVATSRSIRSIAQSAESESVARPTAVLMSLRGNDPSLRGSIEGVLSQGYDSQYQVRIVVDHETDPSVAVLKDLQKNHPHGNRLTFTIMEPPLKTCSLKCHSLSQAVASLPPEIEYIALLDADVRPHRTWLAELTGPLRDEAVGGVTGNAVVRASTGCWFWDVAEECLEWRRDSPDDSLCKSVGRQFCDSKVGLDCQRFE